MRSQILETVIKPMAEIRHRRLCENRPASRVTNKKCTKYNNTSGNTKNYAPWWKILIEKYSSFHHLLRITGIILQYINQLYSKATRKHFWFQKDGVLATALHFYIRKIQFEHFSAVYDDLKNRKPNELASKLQIFIDEENKLRSRGWFRISSNLKSPILLPTASREPFVCLLMMHLQEMNFDSGTSYTLAALRRQYWVQQRTTLSLLHTKNGYKM